MRRFALELLVKWTVAPQHPVEDIGGDPACGKAGRIGSRSGGSASHMMALHEIRSGQKKMRGMKNHGRQSPAMITEEISLERSALSASRPRSCRSRRGC